MKKFTYIFIAVNIFFSGSAFAEVNHAAVTEQWLVPKKQATNKKYSKVSPSAPVRDDLNELSSENPDDIKYWVTKVPTEGWQASDIKKIKSILPGKVPELEAMLNQDKYDLFKSNIIFFLGIGEDPEAVKPLKTYLYNLNPEDGIQSVQILQSFGYLARKSNEAYKILVSWANPDNWSKHKVTFKYGVNYKDANMAVLASRGAIGGLGISGRTDALRLLEKMNNPIGNKYYEKQRSDIKEAIEQNQRNHHNLSLRDRK